MSSKEDQVELDADVAVEDPDAPINLQIDANEALQRAAQYDPNLINRVIAEMQRDKLAQMLEDERKKNRGSK